MVSLWGSGCWLVAHAPVYSPMCYASLSALSELINKRSMNVGLEGSCVEGCLGEAGGRWWGGYYQNVLYTPIKISKDKHKVFFKKSKSL